MLNVAMLCEFIVKCTMVSDLADFFLTHLDEARMLMYNNCMLHQPNYAKCLDEGLRHNFTPAEIASRKLRVDILLRNVTVCLVFHVCSISY